MIFNVMHQCVCVCSHHSEELLRPEDVFLHCVGILLHLGDQQGQTAGLGPAGGGEGVRKEDEAESSDQILCYRESAECFPFRAPRRPKFSVSETHLTVEVALLSFQFALFHTT